MLRIAIALGLCTSARAADDIYLGLRRAGFQPIPVGIPAFVRDSTLTNSAAVDTLRRVLMDDLEFSVLVEPISDPWARRWNTRAGRSIAELRRVLGGDRGTESPPPPPADDAEALWLTRSPLLRETIPDPGHWENAGVAMALGLRIDAGPQGPNILFEMNFVSGGATLAADSLRLLDPRRDAHRIADALVWVATGEAGVAQSHIAWATTRDDWTHRIHRADYDGARRQPVTPEGADALLPSFSPGGEHIACIQYQDSGPDLMVYPVAGGPPQTLSNDPALESTPAWSPLGDQIAYTLARDGNPDIHVVPLDGADPVRLTWSPGIDTSPSWSPRAKQLVFTSDRGGYPTLYVMGETGLAQRRLWPQDGYLDAATWSPRGDRIAYVGRSEGNFHIFSIDPLGGKPVQLTDRGNNESPCWSPDGLHLIFSSDRSGTSVIYTMRVDGSAVRPIRGSRGGITPSWSPPRVVPLHNPASGPLDTIPPTTNQD